jgi:hypothetical protein
VDAAEIVFGEAVVASGEPSVVLEAAEHALDGVAVFVEGFVEAALPLSRALEWDVRDGALALDQVADAVGVVGAVGVDGCSARINCPVGAPPPDSPPPDRASGERRAAGHIDR